MQEPYECRYMYPEKVLVNLAVYLMYMFIFLSVWWNE